MRVSELIEKLQQCDPDDVVVLSCDDEGNRYLRLSHVTVSGKAILDKDSQEVYEIEDMTAYADAYNDVNESTCEPCVVLWP